MPKLLTPITTYSSPLHLCDPTSGGNFQLLDLVHYVKLPISGWACVSQLQVALLQGLYIHVHRAGFLGEQDTEVDLEKSF